MIDGLATPSSNFASGNGLTDGIQYLGSLFAQAALAYHGLIYSGSRYQDYLGTYTRFFGNNFKQDSERIYITKSDLPLSPQLNNSAESLFTALLLRVLTYEGTDITSLINVYHWRTFFDVFNQISLVRTTLVIEINVPVKYKYINVEITSTNDNLSPNDL